MSDLDPIYRLPVDPSLRLKIVCYMDVTRSNPNGDPQGRGPRLDPFEHGFVSCACLKRMIRDYVEQHLEKEIYLKRGTDLSVAQQNYKTKDNQIDVDKMRADLWDLPMFGAPLLQTKTPIRGALQVTDGVSVHPVILEEVPFTSSVGQVQERKKKGSKEETEEYFQSAYNSYHLVNYGLYRFEATFNPADGAKHGVSRESLQALWAGLIEGWEYNRSAHRTGVNLRRVYVFQFPNTRGTEPSHVTAGRVRAELIEGISEPRSFDDYIITVDDNLPSGVLLSRWEDGVVENEGRLAAK